MANPADTMICPFPALTHLSGTEPDHQPVCTILPEECSFLATVMLAYAAGAGQEAATMTLHQSTCTGTTRR